MTLVVTAGHVDHGKSTLVRALTGTDPDRLAEEKRRGLTIDLGFAHAVTPLGNTISFVDVPGHIDFIRTMVSGLNGINVALLVIDAAEGWKPQTQEHAAILSVLGISHGVVALTKCDKVDEQILLEREDEIRKHLAGSHVQWQAIVRTSAHSGAGLEDLLTALDDSHLATSDNDQRSRPRLFIDRVFTMKGAGTVVTGTLDNGVVHTDDQLSVARTGKTVRVREIQTHGSSAQQCMSGSRCALNLAGIEVDELRRGDALVIAQQWHITNVFDAELHALDSLERPVTHRGSYTVHIGTNMQAATIRVLQADLINPGESRNIRVRFTEPIAIAPFDKFLLRDTSTNITIGGGTILDVAPRNRIGRSAPDGTIEKQLFGRGFISVEEAQRLTGITIEPTVGPWVVCEAELQQCITELEDQLATGSVDIARLTVSERDVLSSLGGVVIENGIARNTAVADPLLSHPYVNMMKEAGLTPPDTGTLDRNIIRQLVHRKVLFEHDNIAFHSEVLLGLRPTLSELWSVFPEGFTMSALRDRLTITRKHAVPLATCLDKVGLTKRDGDRRTRGHLWS